MGVGGVLLFTLTSAAAALGLVAVVRRRRRQPLIALSDAQKATIMKHLGVAEQEYVPLPTSPRFRIETALPLAGFAFVVYDEPRIDAREWECRDVDGKLGVAYFDEHFLVRTRDRALAVRAREKVRVRAGNATSQGRSSIFYLRSGVTHVGVSRVDGNAQQQRQAQQQEQLLEIPTSNELVSMEVSSIESADDVRRFRFAQESEAESTPVLRQYAERADAADWGAWLPPPNYRDAKCVCFVEESDTDTQFYLYRYQDTYVYAFRGTDARSFRDMLINIKLSLEEMFNEAAAAAAGDGDSGGGDERSDEHNLRAHAGFKQAYNSVRDVVRELTDDIVRLGAKRILCTGHSLGGALAMLAAYDLTKSVRAIADGRVSLGVYAFGTPRIGNAAFARCYNAAVPETFRICNYHDGIARMPRAALGFAHFGRTVLVDDRNGGRVLVAGESVHDDPLSERFHSWDEFVQYETKSLEALVRGHAIEHHMEASYARALRLAEDAMDDERTEKKSQ